MTSVTEHAAPKPIAPPPGRPRAAAPATVSTAIVLATTAGDDGRPAALLPWERTTVLRRLVDQLASIGTGAPHVVTRPEWAPAVEQAVAGAAAVERSADPAADLRAIARIASSREGGVLVVQGEVVTQREALVGLAADPRLATGVLATVGRVGRPFGHRIHSARGRVVSAESPYHRVRSSTATFLGVLKVSDADRAALVDAAERLAALTDPPLPEGWGDELDRKTGVWRAVLARPGWQEEADREGLVERDVEDETGEPRLARPAHPDAVPLAGEDEDEVRRRAAALPGDAAALLLVALVRSGAQIGVNQLRELFWARPLTPAAVARAEGEIGDFDEDRVLLESSLKGTDGFFTTFFVSPYSKYVARWAARRGLTPNQVTTVSMLIGVLAAAAFATGERAGLVAGAILLQLAFTADCVDGQLARYTRRFSALGAWLDSVFDRTKEYLVYAGLAIGYAATHTDDVWALAAAALTLQTVRHMLDFSYEATRQQLIGAIEHPPLEQTGDRVGSEPAPEQRGAAAPAQRPPLPRRVLGSWRRLDHWPGTVWLKRMATFPIGERFAVISITAALFDAKVAFVAVLAGGLFAGSYTFAGRFLRSVTR